MCASEKEKVANVRNFFFLGDPKKIANSENC